VQKASVLSGAMLLYTQAIPGEGPGPVV
jgi:hypothetical protein